MTDTRAKRARAELSRGRVRADVDPGTVLGEVSVRGKGPVRGQQVAQTAGELVRRGSCKEPGQPFPRSWAWGLLFFFFN